MAGVIALIGVATGEASVVAATADQSVTFTVGTYQDIDSLNVTVGLLVVDYEIWNITLPTLTNKAASDFSIEPGLADQWEVSPDGLTVTYRLRDNMKWSDGQPLTADDVAYTINRSRDEEWTNHASVTANLDATVTDARTVVVTSSVPDPKLPILDVYIVPKHIHEAISAEDLPNYDATDNVAGGPFKIVERKEGEFVRLERNPNWYGAKPDMDQVVFRFFADQESEFTALKAGDIDAVDSVPETLYSTLTPGGEIAPIGGNQGSFRELAMNAGCESGIGDGHVALKDIEVRQAINWAIDRQLLLEKTVSGFGSVGLGIGTSASPAWDLEVPEAEQYKFDPDKARTMLDEAGWVDADGDGVREKDGTDLRFRYFDRSVGDAAETTPFITKWLADIGIATDVRTFDEDSLIAQIGKGEYDMFTWGWTPYVDPDPMLSYFTTAEVTTDPDSPLANDANWCNAEYDELYLAQKQELDPVKRRELVQKMLRIFYDEAAYVVLFKYDDLMAIRSDRWSGFEEARQPAKSGPGLFNNTSPAYVMLKYKGGSSGGGGGAVWLGIGAAAILGLTGVSLFIRRRRGTGDDDRE